MEVVENYRKQIEECHKNNCPDCEKCIWASEALYYMPKKEDNRNAQLKKCRTKVSEVGNEGAIPSPSNVDPHIQKILDLFCK